MIVPSKEIRLIGQPKTSSPYPFAVNNFSAPT